MKETLKSILYENNWFKSEDIPKGWKELNKREGKFYIPDFFSTSNSYEYGVFYNCLSSTDYKGASYNYIEGMEFFIKHIESNIVMTMRNHKGKFTFYPAWFHMHKSNNISSHQRVKAIESVKKPNLIGVFTDKKMFEWVKYCENYINALNSALNEVEGKNAELENEIENFIKDLKGKCKVERWNKYTIVHTDYFKVEFSIDKSCGYLSKKIQYNGDLEGIVFLTNQI
jgi:hypothetical protein